MPLGDSHPPPLERVGTSASSAPRQGVCPNHSRRDLSRIPDRIRPQIQPLASVVLPEHGFGLRPPGGSLLVLRVRAVTGANRDEPHRRNRPGQQFRCHSQAPPTQQMATHRRPLEPPGPKRQRRDQSLALHLLLRIGGRDCFSRPLSRPGSAAGEVRRQARV